MIAAAMVLLCVFAVSQPAGAQGRSGIPEIDSLPVRDWGGPTRPLSYSKAVVYSALVPGGGQFYGKHPVRGGFLLGMETLLAGLAVYSLYVDVPRWEDDIRVFQDSADALFLEAQRSPERAVELDSRRKDFIDLARQRFELKSKQADLAGSQLAWAAGLHLYGILDAVEIAYLSHNPPPADRSPRKALYRGMMFPGGGQWYNRRYGKLGMLWMGLGASAVSAYSRQEVVELLNDRLRTARAEQAAGVPGAAAQVSDLEQDRTLYRKRRNQYFWGMGLLYVYAVLDGMVDASLSDFDAPARFAQGPLRFGVEATPQGAALQYRFGF